MNDTVTKTCQGSFHPAGTTKDFVTMRNSGVTECYSCRMHAQDQHAPKGKSNKDNTVLLSVLGLAVAICALVYGEGVRRTGDFLWPLRLFL